MSLISDVANRLKNLYFKPQASNTAIAADAVNNSLPFFAVDDGGNNYHFVYRKPDGTVVLLTQGPTSGAPSDATYWTAVPNGTLSNEYALSLLTDGIVKHSAGIPARAVPGTDYLTPAQVNSEAIVYAIALGGFL